MRLICGALHATNWDPVVPGSSSTRPACTHRPRANGSSISISSRSPSKPSGKGPHTFFRLLSAGPPRVWGRQARQIFVLRARSHTEDRDAALAHAARFGVPDLRASAAKKRPRRDSFARCLPHTRNAKPAPSSRLGDPEGEGLRTRPSRSGELNQSDRLHLIWGRATPGEPARRSGGTKRACCVGLEAKRQDHPRESAAPLDARSRK
jgi:hypothetical protein